MEGLDTLVIEKEPTAGGQSKYSSRIENYSSYPHGVTGAKLSQDTLKQVIKAGAETKLGVAVVGMTYDRATGLKHLTLSNGEIIDTRAVILAGGVKFTKPTMPGADGPGMVMADPKILVAQSAGGEAIVVGGSNGAAQAALGVSATAKHVTLLSRSPLTKLMSAYQIDAIKANPKITVIEGDQIAQINRNAAGVIQSVELMKQKQLIPAKAVGMFIGSLPETAWLGDAVDRYAGDDEKQRGKIVADSNLETKTPGVFAAGDMRAGTIGRVGVAAGDGAYALSYAYAYLASLKTKPEPKVSDAMPDDDGSIDDLITRWFAFDRENPWLGQTIEGVKAG